MHRIVLALTLALAVTGCGDDSASDGACAPTHIVRDGDVLPDCAFERMGGGSLALKDLRGKPVVLNFWTSWCTACIREMPALQRVHSTLGDRIQLVGMNGLGVLGETREDASKFPSEQGVTYPTAFDVNGQLYSHFFGSATANPIYPLTLYVDADGVIKKTVFGEQTERDLRSNISELFGIS